MIYWVHYRNPEDKLLEFLHTCQGYIILIDLIADVSNVNFMTICSEVAKSLHPFNGKRLSVCLTKYDDPEVLQRIDAQKLLTQNSSKGLLVSINGSQHEGSIELLGKLDLDNAKRFITNGILFGGENIVFLVSS